MEGITRTPFNSPEVAADPDSPIRSSPEAAPAAAALSPAAPGPTVIANTADTITAAAADSHKCDSCDGRSPGVLQECCDKRCTVRLCEGCARGNIWHTQHRTHFIDADKCDWEFKKLPRKPRAAPRTNPVRGSVGGGSLPASRKRVRFVGVDEDEEEEEEEDRRPAKRAQLEPPRQLAPKPVAQMTRAPLPSIAPPRRAIEPSFTPGPGPQAYRPVADTIRLANAAVAGLERREAEGYRFQAPPRAYEQPQISRVMGTRQPETYTIGPQRDYQPGTIPSHLVPLPSNSWPTSLSSEEIRQIQSLYRIIIGADYTGNIGTYYRRPLPRDRTPHPATSPGRPLVNTYGQQHYQNTGIAAGFLPPILSTGYVQRSSQNYQNMIDEDERIRGLFRGAWSDNRNVIVIRHFQGDYPTLKHFWDVFNLFCLQNNIREAPITTNWFVDKKREIQWQQETTDRANLNNERNLQREARERFQRSQGQGNPPY
ncbi:hypothetical protein QBC41DRAFT_367032 [Cercophora samala]|uniref:Uncharacterized protein n=1 Tax=Cercophora samala TaxID=330535 RepID=A0AA39Z9C2_9PEZI|nr:hypothetical protein QBC41DRAFT_367032 [Cercophora samala]